MSFAQLRTDLTLEGMSLNEIRRTSLTVYTCREKLMKGISSRVFCGPDGRSNDVRWEKYLIKRFCFVLRSWKIGD